MAKTQLNVETIKTEAVRPLYAVAGATDLAVEVARGYATGAQTRFAGVQKKASSTDFEPRNLQKHAITLVQNRVDELAKDAKQAQARFEKQLVELQDQAKGLPAQVQARVNDALKDINGTYDGLTVRGEKFVAAVRKDGVRAVATTTNKPAARKAPATKKADAAKKAPATKAAARKAPAQKSAAQKSTATKASTKSS